MENISGAENKTTQRLQSLDALRGFDMFWIVSGESIFHGIAAAIKNKHALLQDAVNWQISTNESLSGIEFFFVGISNQLHHTVWNGFTFYDLIFPLFIFIAGISMPLSFTKQLKNTANVAAAKKKLYQQLLKRTIILLLLGMILNGLLQFNGYENTRFASVLGRIALSCFFAAIIFLNSRLQWQIIWFAALLLGYWAIMMWFPVPVFGAGQLTPEGNFAGYIDRLFLPGKLHRAVYDPEGLLSTIPAIASALLGVFTGQFLLMPVKKIALHKKALYLFITGIALVITGWLWGLIFPLNKNMWTSSYVLFAGGCSLLLFSIFYYCIDVLQFKKWSMPFVWLGSNAILIYVAAHGLVKFEPTSQFLFGGMVKFFPAIWHDAVLQTGVAMIQFALLYFLYRKKWFLKL
jgi:predicted acyltransferase